MMNHLSGMPGPIPGINFPGLPMPNFLGGTGNLQHLQSQLMSMSSLNQQWQNQMQTRQMQAMVPPPPGAAAAASPAPAAPASAAVPDDGSAMKDSSKAEPPQQAGSSATRQKAMSQEALQTGPSQSKAVFENIQMVSNIHLLCDLLGGGGEQAPAASKGLETMQTNGKRTASEAMLMPS